MITILIVSAAVGSGIIAGLLFTFSNFVMKALGQLPPGQGIRAMQTFNSAILNPMFLSVFIGSAVLSLFILINHLFQWLPGSSAAALIGSCFYLFGVFIITAAVNVPLNNQLDGFDSDQPDSVQFWEGFLKRWTRWNHLRTVSAICASTAFILSLI